MIYFKVGTGNTAVDYSNRITSDDDYNVEKHNIAYRWTDGFGGEHEKVYNTIVEGKFNLWFADANNGADFTSFLSTLTSKMSDGVLPVTIYCKNTNTEESISVNYEISTKKFGVLRNNVRGFVVTVIVQQAAVYS